MRIAGTSFVVALILALVLATGAIGASGTWERSWGKDVVSGGETGPEVCTLSTSCKSGAGGIFGGELASVETVAVDGSGNVYVTDSANQRIDKFSAAGKWLLSWGRDVVAGGSEGAEICTVAASCKGGKTGAGGGEFVNPVGVAAGPGGSVYVVEAIPGERVQKFDSSGNFVAAWGKNVLKTGGGGEDEVCTEAESCQLGETGGLGGEFDDPDGIATDSAGTVYVSDYLNNRIEKLEPSGEFLSAWGKDVVAGGGTGFEVCTVKSECKGGSAGELGGDLSRPVGISAQGGRVFVGDTFNNRAQSYSAFGAWERAWGKDVVAGGGTGFEVCASAANCKAGTGGTGEAGEFDGGPYGVAADASGNVYTADTNGNRIEVFNGSTGGFVAAWGKDVVSGGGNEYEICTVALECKAGVAGALGGEMSQPFGLAVDSGGNLFVADRNNNRVDRFSDTGPPSESGGEEEEEEEEGNGGGGGGPTGGSGGPTGGSSTGSAPDTTPPGIEVHGKAKQRLGKLSLAVHSDEAATVTVQAVVSIPGGGRRRSKTATAGVNANGTVTLKLRFVPSALRALTKALEAGKHPSAAIGVTVRDTAGNTSPGKLSVRLLR